MNSHKIKQWFFDNFENIVDEVLSMEDLTLEILNSNDEVFHDEIEHQALDEFIRSVSISCSTTLALSYEECYDTLEDNLEELFYAIK